jgi:hypothetical protein
MAINKKYCVEAITQWNLFPTIFVSVMNEDGTPVTGLTKNKFKVARMGNGGPWVEVPITTLNSNGASHGFYFLAVQKNDDLNWNFSPDMIFTVEVNKTSGTLNKLTSFRGQCFAPMHSMTT